ncbi:MULTISPECIES: cache domain-containing sensor histidine kinase [Metabacillus]|uniref:histidine kinase n=2 Tax=Metabacillus TaxID=2675233 RepID=A0A179SLM6_9BACI|nr:MULTISPECIES: sensor histidine kinase [Metabacillus]OAS82585.1 histidine kinase [Metabacillus litoralis]QNF26771.1 sensor histidine kinase [Metabacillus sp. KUDC1714]
MRNKFHKFFLFFRIKKIRNRFLAVMIALSVPPIFIVGVVSYNTSKDTLIENHLQANETHLKTTSEKADFLLRNVINMERYILSNKDLRQQLIESGSISDMEQEALKLNMSSRLQQIMSDYVVEQKYIDSVCLFDNYFRAVCYGRSDDAGRYERENKRSEIIESDWYNKAVEAQGKELFFSDNVLEELNWNNTFSSVKLLRNPTSSQQETIGLLIVNINKSLFSEMMNETNNNEYLILDATTNEMKTVYASTPSYYEEVVGKDLPFIFEKKQEEDYVVSHYTNETTGWTFAYFIKEQELLKQPHQIRAVTILIALLISISAVILSVILSDTITRPLLRIKKMMVAWAKGSSEFNETFHDDEVGAIGETFKRMTAENKDLSERLIRSQLKERETELRVLQAQINPHFLYNTLDSIYWMAMIHNHEDIGKMAVSLSESFKIILNKGKEIIPLYRELKHIEHYMTIQNIRYGDRFTYIQEVDPLLMDQEILKLLLQPLVENAIYHGLEPKVGEGMIRVTGSKESDFILFTVEDDGVGIKDMAMIEQGYGLGNVRERLTIYYGPTSSLTIKSEVNKGTKIEIRFNPKEGRWMRDAESRNI